MLQKNLARFLAALCVIAATHAASPKKIATDFASGPNGWSAGFADYPVGSEEFYELQSGMRKLPASLGLARKAFFLSGNNHSDDLCMFLRRRVSGLAPNTRYRVHLSMTFASASPKNSVGVGGAPSIIVKAGVGHRRPSTLTTRGYARLNIDKGNQAVGGRDAEVIGNTGVNVPSSGQIYRLKRLTNAGAPFSFKTDAAGAGWLFICTDSGFETTMSLYFIRISASFIAL